MPFSGTAMAAGKTSANQMTGKTHTAQTTAVEDVESPKTTFPVHVIHKTGNDKENFVKNDDIILTEYVVIYRIYFCSYQVRGEIHFNPNIILYIERTQTNIK